MEAEQKSVEVKDFKFDIEGGKAIVTGGVVASHKYGSLEFDLKANVSTAPIVEKIAGPVIDKVIDLIEKAIPGDQTGQAEKLKEQARVEIKEILEKL